jgi:hypothetical protein
LERPDAGGWYEWEAPDDGDDKSDSYPIDETVPCRVIEADSDDSHYYRVFLQDADGSDMQVKKVPRSAIRLVDRPYTNNQFLRRAFRHEIQLPNDMVPTAWRDLAPAADDECGLYMAESSIPNSGLGMYTARAISRGEQIFYGDVVIQVEDPVENARLRRRFNKQTRKESPWLLHSYFWDSFITKGDLEANEVESILPGLGMLANSHTGLVNADNVAPERVVDLHRSKDPGAGASTHFHNVHFDAVDDIEPGSEIFVEYVSFETGSKVQN